MAETKADIKREGNFLKTQFVFAKKPEVPDRIAQASGICLLLRNFPRGEKVDFKNEAERLAMFLTLVFPGTTLALLKKHLPDVPDF